MTIGDSVPGFIGIGVQKSATTWLYDNLRDHPEVCVSGVKEVNFFSYHYDHGLQWYERQFAATPQSRISGEISPSYFYEPAVPQRVARCAPAAKLIAVLRDPVDRALSNHKHEVREGHFIGSDLSFEAGLANNPTYVDQGLYATHLKRWLEYFPREQILVLLFDEIVDDPGQVAKRLYRFLGIDDSHVSGALHGVSNEGYVNRSPQLHEVRRRIRLAAAAAGLGKVWEGLARFGLRNLYRRYNRLPSEALVPPVSEDVRRELRLRFDEEIAELEGLIGRSLAGWRVQRAEAGPDDSASPAVLQSYGSR